MKNNRKVLLLLLLVFVLSGCSVRSQDTVVTTDSVFTGGFPNIWNLLVLFISKTMVFFGNILGNNLVWGMIITTIIFRFLLLPLYKKSIKSQQEIQLIQPELEKLKKKYPNKEDAQKRSLEQQALYKRHNINPLAGCIPLLIQMPLLFVFYDAIKNLFVYAESSLPSYGAEELSTRFLMFNDVSSLNILPLAIATGITTFLATYVSMIGTNSAEDNPAAGVMKTMLYVMPVMIGITAYGFPGALALYWMTGNIFSTLQTIYFKRDVIKEERTKKKILKK